MGIPFFFDTMDGRARGDFSCAVTERAKFAPLIPVRNGNSVMKNKYMSVINPIDLVIHAVSVARWHDVPARQPSSSG
jgi:hypothetical protein